MPWSSPDQPTRRPRRAEHGRSAFQPGAGRASPGLRRPVRETRVDRAGQVRRAAGLRRAPVDAARQRRCAAHGGTRAFRRHGGFGPRHGPGGLRARPAYRARSDDRGDGGREPAGRGRRPGGRAGRGRHGRRAADRRAGRQHRPAQHRPARCRPARCRRGGTDGAGRRRRRPSRCAARRRAARVPQRWRSPARPGRAESRERPNRVVGSRRARRGNRGGRSCSPAACRRGIGVAGPDRGGAVGPRRERARAGRGLREAAARLRRAARLVPVGPAPAG